MLVVSKNLNSVNAYLFFYSSVRLESNFSVCREISKIHEESVRGTLTEVIAHFTQNEPRGEIVIVLGGKED